MFRQIIEMKAKIPNKLEFAYTDYLNFNMEKDKYKYNMFTRYNTKISNIHR